MSTRALIWLGSLALLMQAWIARPLLEPARTAPIPSTASTVAVSSASTFTSAPEKRSVPELIAELRIGDWSLSLRRSAPVESPKPVTQPRMT